MVVQLRGQAWAAWDVIQINKRSGQIVLRSCVVPERAFDISLARIKNNVLDWTTCVVTSGRRDRHESRQLMK